MYISIRSICLIRLLWHQHVQMNCFYLPETFEMKRIIVKKYARLVKVIFQLSVFEITNTVVIYHFKLSRATFFTFDSTRLKPITSKIRYAKYQNFMNCIFVTQTSLNTVLVECNWFGLQIAVNWQNASIIN